MTTIGKNTASGERLRGFIERVEAIRAEKKECGEREKLVWAECKAAGFTPAIMKTIVKRRAMKPADLEEAESLLDMYQHALGMLPEPPLFRHVSLMSVDTSARDQVIEAMSKFVPTKGHIIVDAGGQPVRMERGKDGVVQITNYVPPTPQANAAAPVADTARPSPPNVDEDGAQSLGEAAYHENQPVISNPFPPGDPRRARFDLGWRRASGSDGMGEDD